MSKKVVLPNDYERMIPEFHSKSVIYGEHLVRYLAAQKLVKGKIVLDIASGSGYGTLVLAKSAKKVIGVDVFDDTVRYAQENYPAKNIEYIQGDGVRIPLADNSVEVVVSFETIEHIEDYDTFIKEVKRVLKSDGLFVLSTPNDVEFAEGNHYHIHEFEHAELKKLVGKYFSDLKEYFQADWLYTGIHSQNEIAGEWEEELKVINVAPLGIDQSLYFFMLCANRGINEDIDSFGALSEHWSERKNQEKNILTQNHIQNIQDVADANLRYARELEGKLEALMAENKKAGEELAKIGRELADIKATFPFKAYNKFKKLR